MAKHYVLKTHASHKVFIIAISVIMLIIGVSLVSNLSEFNVSDADFRTYTVILLFVLVVILVVLVLMQSWFIIELKDRILDTEEVEEKILRSVKKR